MKVIITGANGFIGSHLVRKFAKNGHDVIAVVRNQSENIDSIKGKCQITCSEIDDLNSRVSLQVIPEGAIVYHLAWQGVNGPDKANPLIQTHNIEMALKAAEFARQINAKKFLCAGTIAEQAVNSLPSLSKTSGGMMYGSAKAALRIMLETYCKNIDLPLVWMQFSNIYGPNNKTGNLVSYTLGQLANGEEATFGPAAQPYDFIFVDNLIEAAYRLGVKDTRETFYCLSSGTPRLLKDYLMEIGTIFGRPGLIKIGVRPDDGIKYDFSMFDNSSLIEDIGEYVSGSFEDLIRYTIRNYQ